jgi:hypothetical protein
MIRLHRPVGILISLRLLPLLGIRATMGARAGNGTPDFGGHRRPEGTGKRSILGPIPIHPQSASPSIMGGDSETITPAEGKVTIKVSASPASPRICHRTNTLALQKPLQTSLQTFSVTPVTTFNRTERGRSATKACRSHEGDLIWAWYSGAKGDRSELSTLRATARRVWTPCMSPGFKRPRRARKQVPTWLRRSGAAQMEVSRCQRVFVCIMTTARGFSPAAACR